MTHRHSRIRELLLVLILFVGGGLLVACDSSDPGVEDDEITIDDIDATAILTNEASNVILATYVDLEGRAGELQNAVQAFVDNPSPSTLDAAQQAWIDARDPWEASESFLFGPVAEDDLDPALDSWPVDESNIQGVLNSSDAITPDLVRNLSTNSKGFHTVEFLLFGPNGDKTPSDFTDREIDYLTAATTVLFEDTQALAGAWRPEEGGFATDFVNAQTSVASSPKGALDALAEGMEIIADEVGSGKIGTPLEEGTIARVESKYSENSLVDFTNNMRSLRRIYTGDVGSSTGPGLDDVVAAVNPELDEQIRSEIETAIQTLEGSPLSFRKSIEQNQLQTMRDAQDAILDIRDTVQSELRPLISNL